jgi:Fic/DOC family
MTVVEYVTEEVRRQGHNIYDLDGIERVGWMLNAWGYALEHAAHSRPDMHCVISIGRMVERVKNAGGLRRCGVRVGTRTCPPHKEVHGMLNSLFLRRDELTPMQFYKEFELIHPFVDGNGRTGKVLLNWLNGTLCDPVFPPNDFWGEWIDNP